MKVKSIQTTVVGISAFVVALGMALPLEIDGNPETVGNWNAVVTAGILMVGLILARDNNKSSEDVGAK